MTSVIQEQERAHLNVEKNTSGSFTNKPRIRTSRFIVPVSVLPVVAISEHTTSTSDRE